MIIGSLSENKEIEKRISITPEIVKKYLSNGFEVLIDKGFGEHLGFSDDLFKNAGCKVVRPLADELYSGMKSMLSSSNSLKETGKNFQSLILQKYTWKKTAEKYLNIADSICQ